MFTPYYDKYYEIYIERGWIDDNDRFNILKIGKNRRLGYSINLIPGENMEKHTPEDIQDSISNIEFDDMKVIEQDGLTFVIDAQKVSDITKDDVLNILNITKEQFIQGDNLIKEQLKNCEVGEQRNIKVWINNGTVIFKQDTTTNIFRVHYNQIWRKIDNIIESSNMYDFEVFLILLLETNLNCDINGVHYLF